MDARRFHKTIVPLYRELFAAAVAIVGNRDEAADVVQDTMVKLWNNRDTLEEAVSPRAFAIATLRNTAIDSLRKRPQARQDEDVNEPAVPPDDGADVEALTCIIESLPARQRQVIILSAIEGHSPEEIAKSTGLSAENVRQLLSRGRRKIKELYTKLST
ncbi:MAG: RNA polymerase sigma factor [Muribaculaceae bacterium]|nr:RNA polymerase sigma factor [Muribaculaceae bacterium]